MIVFSREAATFPISEAASFPSSEAAIALSCGRKPADQTHPRAASREAALATHCYRRFAAPRVFRTPFHGLTPTATRCHRFAIKNQRRRVIRAGN